MSDARQQVTRRKVASGISIITVAQVLSGCTQEKGQPETASTRQMVTSMNTPQSSQRLIELSDRIPLARQNKDLTEILQQAVDEAAGDAQLDGVRIPEGIWPLRKLRIPGSLLIAGHGMDKTKIVKSGKSGRWIQFTNLATQTMIQDVSFDARGLVSGAVLTAGPYTSGISLVGCEITNSGSLAGIGVDIGGRATRIKIEGCRFVGSNIAVRIRQKTSDIRVESCLFQDWVERAIQCLGDSAGSPREVVISACQILPHAAGGKVRQPIQFNGVDEQPFRVVRIVDNVVTGRGTDYKDPLSPGTADLISLHRCVDFEVLRNTCTDGGDVGITVSQQSSDGRVSDNNCLRNDSAGICIGSSTSKWTRNVTVERNNCQDNGRARFGLGTPGWARTGININHGQKIRVAANILGNSPGSGTQEYGISITESQSIEIGENEFTAGLRSRFWSHEGQIKGGL